MLRSVTEFPALAYLYMIYQPIDHAVPTLFALAEPSTRAYKAAFRAVSGQLPTLALVRFATSLSVLACKARTICRLLIAACGALLATLFVAKGRDCATEFPSLEGAGGCCGGHGD